MKKRFLAMTLASVTAASMIMSGCGKSEDTNEKATDSTGAQTEATGEESKSEGGTKELTYWSMWNSTEGQAKIIQEAADAYEAETGIHINIEWKGRDIKTLIGPALDAGENVDFFDTDYMMLTQQNDKYLADLTDMAAAADYEKHVMPILLENAKEWSGGKLKASGVNPMTCNSDGVTLLYGYQLARYIGQDKVLETLDNADWANVPEAKKAADDIHTLFEKGYMSEYAPANYPEGQNEIGFGESCMILNASWIPNEINQNTGATVDWGFFPWPTVEGGVDGAEASMVGSQGFGIVDKSENKQEAFDFILTVVTGDYDSKMAEAVWNEYFLSLIFAFSEKNMFVGPGLKSVLTSMQYTGDWGGLFAAVVIVFLPTLLLFILLSKTIIGGITNGGVKG